MIQIPPQAKIFSIPEPMLLDDDIDDYVTICKRYGLDPYSGEVFTFKDEEAIRIGVLSYDGHGMHWCIKRFSEGNVAWWPSEKKVVQISARDFQIMLWGGNPRQIELPGMWKPLHED